MKDKEKYIYLEILKLTICPKRASVSESAGETISDVLSLSPKSNVTAGAP